MVAVFPALCQEAEDIAEFLNKGQECYNKHDLQGAAIEFENVLMLDSRNFEAKVWLAQIYTDMKLLHKARNLLEQIRKVAPEHARVKALSKLIGDEPAKITKREPDLVVHEALTILGSGTRLRPFGLVIPEGKVKDPEEAAPIQLEEKVETGEPAPELAGFNKQEGPLGAVFEAWTSEGLNAGLDAYFRAVIDDVSLAEADDHGLLKEGLKFFEPRLRANASDPETLYYLGMIAYFNGVLDRSAKFLDPLRGSDGPRQEMLSKVLADLDKRKAQEEARLAAIRKEEEAREAAKKAEAERQAAAQAAAAQASANTASPGAPLTGTDAMHAEGYELYKKGQLDAAIEKFQSAIKEKATEPKFFYHLGLALTDKGLAGNVDSFDRAIESFNQVIHLDPGSKMAKDSEVMIRDIVAAKNSLKR